MDSDLYSAIIKYLLMSAQVILLFYALKTIFEKIVLFINPVFGWVVGAIVGAAIFVLFYDSVDKKLFFLYFSSVKWSFLGLAIYSLVCLKKMQREKDKD